MSASEQQQSEARFNDLAMKEAAETITPSEIQELNRLTEARRAALGEVPIRNVPMNRVTLSRKRGWRMPPNTVKVCRGTPWGNPFRVGFQAATQAEAVAMYVQWLRDADDGRFILDLARQLLPGKHLACWCKPGTPCHADVLMRLVNTDFALAWQAVAVYQAENGPHVIQENHA